jgi:sulfate adenylyltransferase subunit 1 (EFTu-like GTPase family)
VSKNKRTSGRVRAGEQPWTATALLALDRLGLNMNDIGECVLRLDRLVGADAFWDIKDTGSFILIDAESYDTVGMGLVKAVSGQAPHARNAHASWLRRLRDLLRGKRVGATS